MKILAIRGRNLASLDGDFALELTEGELAEAGLFAICGPVGAGKSTLLDALSLALFDRTPRLQGRGGAQIAEEGRPEKDWLHSHDPRTLLRRGAGEAYAEVDFRGRDGRRYRAKWSVRRARRKATGKMQPSEMELRDLDSGVVIAADKKTAVLEAIGERLGLDFEQFGRSVLLAQGDFASFLRAEPPERASLLESLTGADIYRRLSKAAHERFRAARSDLERMTRSLDERKPLDDEARSALEARVEKLEREAGRIGQMLEEAGRAVEWYRTAAERRDLAEAARKELENAREKQRATREAKARLETLKRALSCLGRLEAVMERQEKLVAAIGRRREAEETCGSRKDDLGKREQELARAVEEFVPGAKGTTPPIATDPERWRPLLDRWVRECRRVDALGASLAELEERTENLGQRHAERAKAVVLARSALAEHAGVDLPAAQEEWKRRQAVHDDRAEALRDWKQAGLEVGKARGKVKKREERLRLLDERRRGFEAARAAAEGELCRRRRRLEEARARRDLAAFREHLRDGEPCPLCGSPEHPAPVAGATDEEFAALEQAADEAERAAVDARTALAGGVAERDACAAELGDERSALEKARADEREAAAAFRKLLVGVTVDGVEQAAEIVDEEESRLNAERDALAERAKALETGREELRRAETLEREAADALRDAGEALREARGVHEAFEQAAADLSPAFAGVADWCAGLRALGDRIGPGFQRIVEAEARRAEARAAFEAAERVRDRIEVDVSSCESELEGAREAFAKECDKSGVEASAVGEARELGAEGIAKEKAELDAIDRAVEAAEVVVKERQDRLREHGEDDPPAVVEAAAEAMHAKAKREAEANQKQLVAEKVRLEADDSLKREHERRGQEVEKRRAECEVWAALDELIGHSTGDRFAKFAQGLTLDVLLIEANRRLRELAPRYRLRRNTSRDMDLVVVDLDLGEARRGVQSLSGGETFLVSLALALSLATLAAPRSRVETMFLDEGFGTLDAPNLEIALAALDSLQAKGCQVGIISHVEGIAERIGTAVEVVPQGGGVSRVDVRSR